MPYPTLVDGLGLDGLAEGINPGLLQGRKLKWFGQTANTSAGNVANQGLGTVSLPALGANTSGTVVIGDGLIGATSILLLCPNSKGDATAGRGVFAWVESVGAGTATIGYRCAAAMSGAWDLHYLVLN